jgi:hypothetical protein
VKNVIYLERERERQREREREREREIKSESEREREKERENLPRAAPYGRNGKSGDVFFGIHVHLRI